MFNLIPVVHCAPVPLSYNLNINTTKTISGTFISAVCQQNNDTCDCVSKTTTCICQGTIQNSMCDTTGQWIPSLEQCRGKYIQVSISIKSCEIY